MINSEIKKEAWGTITLPNANAKQSLMSTVEKIGGFEWQVLPPASDTPDHLVIVCNEQSKQLWFCKTKLQVHTYFYVNRQFYGREGEKKENVGGQEDKHCFNSYNKFNIRFKQPGEGMPASIAVDIGVMWSTINLPDLDASLTVNYSGKTELFPVSRYCLAIQSKYFNNLYFGDWQEQKKQNNSASEEEKLRELIEEPNFDVKAFTFLLSAKHVLGPMLPEMLPFPCWSKEDMQTKLAMLKLAIKYDFPAGAEFAENALIARRSTCTELLEMLEAADELGLAGLKQHCLQNVKSAEYCSQNFGQNCDIRARLRKETRKELDARLEATAEQQQPPIKVADLNCFDV